MGREVRRVPKDWEHPRSSRGGYIPMYEEFPYCEGDVEEGLRDGWLTGDPPHYDVPVMPDWPESERTHWQMYENTSEGTPISPVCETPEDLARWLADNNASSFGPMTATYEQWLHTIQRGFAPSMVLGPCGLKSGVEGL